MFFVHLGDGRFQTRRLVMHHPIQYVSVLLFDMIPKQVLQLFDRQRDAFRYVWVGSVNRFDLAGEPVNFGQFCEVSSIVPPQYQLRITSVSSSSTDVWSMTVSNSSWHNFPGSTLAMEATIATVARRWFSICGTYRRNTSSVSGHVLASWLTVVSLQRPRIS